MCGTDEVAILLNNGDGTFPTNASFYSGGPNPWGIAVGGFDGDGNLDVVVSNLGPNVSSHYIGRNVAVLRGRGDGTFEPARVFRVGQGPAGVVVADFNGDNRPDIAVSNFESDTVSVLLNTSSGAGDILSGAGFTLITPVTGRSRQAPQKISEILPAAPPHPGVPHNAPGRPTAHAAATSRIFWISNNLS